MDLLQVWIPIVMVIVAAIGLLIKLLNFRMNKKHKMASSDPSFKIEKTTAPPGDKSAWIVLENTGNKIFSIRKVYFLKSKRTNITVMDGKTGNKKVIILAYNPAEVRDVKSRAAIKYVDNHGVKTKVYSPVVKFNNKGKLTNSGNLIGNYFVKYK